MPYQIDPDYGHIHPVVSEGASIRYCGEYDEDIQDVTLSDENDDYLIHMIANFSIISISPRGVSRSSQLIYKDLLRAFLNYSTETAFDWGQLFQSPKQPEQRFKELADEWRSSQGVTSSLTQIALIPAYQQIIGMGELAVPYIFRELEKEPDHWFWALKSITGVDPVSEENRGNIRQMATEWLEWGKKQGYRW